MSNLKKSIHQLSSVYRELEVAFGEHFTKFYTLLSFLFANYFGRVDTYTKISNTGAILVIVIVERYQNSKNKLHIAYIWVREEYRRNHYAQIYIESIEQLYRDIGVSVITAYTFTDNWPMQKLLQKLGYRVKLDETNKFAYWTILQQNDEIHDEEWEEKQEEHKKEITTVFYKVL
jgi:ribosomal protein S18 acetylase RimI-like enzyme